MSAIGPELPPHLLAKRKRKNEEEVENERTTSSGAKRSPSPSEGEKRRRVVGPVMPPASLDERPTEPPGQTSDSDSDDDDGFGPSLPPTGTEPGNDDSEHDNQNSSAQSDPATSELKPKRDDWMMMPPKQDDLAARMDPTKQRPRAFNTGKGARAPNPAGEDSSTWNETPEQKQKRLADEMMGISKPSSVGPQRPTKPTNAERDEADAKHIKEHTVSILWRSLRAAQSFDLLTRYCRRKCAGPHYYNNIPRAKAPKPKMIRANVHSIGRRIWGVGCASAMFSDSRC